MKKPQPSVADAYGRQYDQAAVNKPLRSTFDPTHREATEYGGVPGLIQPAPHDVTDYPGEQLGLIYNTDPAVEEPEGGLDIVESKLMRKYTD